MYNKEHGKAMPDWISLADWNREIINDLCKYQRPLQIYASISYGKRKDSTRSFKKFEDLEFYPG